MAFFYFSFADPKKQKFTSFLSSVITRGRPIPHSLQTLYIELQPAIPSTLGLERTLESIVQGSGDIFIVMDALDESLEEAERDERTGILMWLKKIFQQQISNLHVLVTSGKEPEIEDVLISSLQSPSLCIEKTSIWDDIRLYVTSQLENDRRLRKLDQLTKEEIKTALVNGAEGM